MSKDKGIRVEYLCLMQSGKRRASKTAEEFANYMRANQIRLWARNLPGGKRIDFGRLTNELDRIESNIECIGCEKKCSVSHPLFLWIGTIRAGRLTHSGPV